MRDAFSQVALVGGGIMGGDIAAVFASGNWKVHIAEPSESVRKGIFEKVGTALRKAYGADKGGALHTYPSLDDIPWPDITLVVECVTEDLDLKRGIFRRLEEHTEPSTPLASNSSGIPISRIAEGLATRSRMLGLHFFMPAHLVPLVEVICSSSTDPSVADSVSETMKSLGKRPVKVSLDIPGFLANRIQHALMREALWLVERGIASVEDVDAAVRYGFGFRFIAAGPFLQKDFSGLDTLFAAARTIYPDLCNARAPSPFLKSKVDQGHTGAKGGQGFYPWTDADWDREKKAYERRLRAALDILTADEMDDKPGVTQ